MTRVHGITEAEAQAEIGAGGREALLELLADPAFPRRDNVVAFLAWLGGADVTSRLLGILESPPAAADVPEEDRALLLVPRALGLLASRGDVLAESALVALATGESGPGGSDLLRLHGLRGADRTALAADLRSAAVEGLELAGTPAARGLQRRLGITGTGASFGERDLGLHDAPPALLVDDASGVAHAAALTFANHPSLASPMTETRVASILRLASLAAARADYADDVACCFVPEPQGSALTFGALGDGLDSINNASELGQVLDDPVARVKVVRTISNCGGPGMNIIGCAWVAGHGMAVVRLTDATQEALLWLHEYGHNCGLNHVADARNVMAATLSTTNTLLTALECGAYHLPPQGTEAIAEERGDCSDSDGDGIHDAADDCPDIADPMQADTDGDGTGDACDLCPTDGLKGAPGTCGCGIADTDMDGDGTPDCLDLCPSDPAKVAPGTCGCNTSDVDGDGDGTPNCIDACPIDPLKDFPGACGCGTPDTDVDMDGTADCHDGCPVDPAKTAPGACGCGVPDADMDMDGTADCNDGCPADPAKTAPGACGCGMPDTDADMDGTADCADGCPLDPAKLAPGTCGCGTPDDDLDADGHLRCLDNCPSTPNPGQEDEDQDGTGDACECLPGDLSEDGLVGLTDFVLGRRKLLGTLPVTDRDRACGDLHPGFVACTPGAGAAHWCVDAPDGAFSLNDVVVLRRILLQTLSYSCESCVLAGATGRGSLRLPGDIAPGAPGQSLGDGRVDVADVVLALRLAVGLEDGSPEQRLRADVAPATWAPTGRDAGLAVVEGDGDVTVADVVLLLRAAVDLELLAWPAREVSVEVDGPSPSRVASLVTVIGWPGWATPLGATGPGCGDGTGAGFDADGSRWGVACITDPEPSGGSLLATFVHRSPEAVDVGFLEARATLVTAGLVEAAPNCHVRTRAGAPGGGRP